MAERSTKPLIVAPLIVAIDGPAGAGKSTVARALAQRFGLLNIESGAMYRAFALKAIHDRRRHHRCRRARNARSRHACAPGVHSEAGGIGNRVQGNRVLLDGVDVTGQLRTPQITAAASEVSVHPPIRRWLVGLQQALGAQGNVVMEGRDIGTVVFPHAPVKIFLDASPEKRGERRYEQNRGDSSPWRSADGAAPPSQRNFPPPCSKRSASGTAATAPAQTHPCARRQTPPSSTPPT